MNQCLHVSVLVAKMPQQNFLFLCLLSVLMDNLITRAVNDDKRRPYHIIFSQVCMVNGQLYSLLSSDTIHLTQERTAHSLNRFQIILGNNAGIVVGMSNSSPHYTARISV